MTTYSNLLKTFQKYIGIKEEPRGSNGTIFNTWYYGRPVTGVDYPWCVAFPCYVYNEAGCFDEFYGGKKTASSSTLYSYHKARGTYLPPTSPAVGAIGWLKHANYPDPPARHTFWVQAVDNRKFYTIEGNTSAAGYDSNGGMVCEKEYVIGDSKVLGFGITKFLPEEEEMDQPTFNKFMETWIKEREKLPVDPALGPQLFQEAIKLDITDGKTPMRYATRQEVAAMIVNSRGK